MSHLSLFKTIRVRFVNFVARFRNRSQLAATPTTRRIGLVIALALGIVRFSFPGQAAPFSYLDNGTVRIGVDLGKGGSITYLSKSGTSDNLINNYDLGRQIQQSYYSGPQPYNPSNNMHPNWPNWPWNPIQTGDVYGNPSQILAHTNTGQMLYVKCVPMQWALKNVPGDCTFESWISLAGNVVTVSNRLINLRADTNQYPARHQELPAVYTIGRLYRLVSYAGLAPFTGDAITNFPTTPPPWVYWRATENWAALLDANNWGLGVYHPGTVLFAGGFAGNPGSGGPNSSSTGYMTPLHTEILDGNITYTYSYQLILGTLTEIRNWVYAQRYRPDCDFSFQTDRQHWSYPNISDTGWPLTDNRVRVKLASSNPMMLSPLTAFYATNVPKIYIRAAYSIANPAGRATGQLYWETNNSGVMTESASVSFPVIPDGQFHTYELNMSSNRYYHGLITQLRFDPAIRGDAGDYVDLVAISSSPIAGLSMENLIRNGNFTVNAASFTNWPGYTSSASPDNPAIITDWENINDGGVGLNGTGVSFASANVFGPTNPGGRTYAFIQGGTNGLRQSLTLRPNTTYVLDYEVAARSSNTVSYQVQITDEAQTYFTTENVAADNAWFVRVKKTFTTPETLVGNPTIQLLNPTPGDNTVVFANVSLLPHWPTRNEAPSFNTGINQTVLEDSGPRSIAFWATAIKAGPSYESWQQVSFICSNNNNALFSVQPAVSTNGTLTFTPATNANGIATVTIWARDDGGTADGGQDTSPPKTFLITVQAVNDPPIAAPDTIYVYWNSTTTLDLSNLLMNDSDPEGDPLTITALTPGENTAAVTLTATDSLLYTPTPGVSGPASFTYLVSDGKGGQATGVVSVNVIKPEITVGQLLPDNRFHLDFQGLPNHSYRLQCSTNLTDWMDLATITAAGNGRLQYDDSMSAMKFYRFVWP